MRMGAWRIFHKITWGTCFIIYFLLTYKNNHEPKIALKIFATDTELMLILKSLKSLTYSAITSEAKIGKAP